MIWYEPTDAKKASKPWTIDVKSISFASPNLNEFKTIIRYLSKDTLESAAFPEDCSLHSLKQILSLCKSYLSSLRGLMITFGEDGFMIVRWSENGKEDSPIPIGDADKELAENNTELVGMYFNPKANVSIASVSGAGDCLASGFLAGLLSQKTMSESAWIGFACATLSLQASEAVPTSLNSSVLSSLDKLPYTLVHL